MKGFGENKNKNSNKSNLVKSDKDKFLKSQIDLAKNYLLSGDVINKVFLDEDQNKYFLNIYWKKNKIWGATAKILIDLINLLKINND